MHQLLKKYLSKIGKKGGQSKSPRKVEASRRNGKKGGNSKVKKILGIVILICMTGCTASMVTTRGGGGNQYAPVNEAKGGTVKYLNQGYSSAVKARRDDAYKQMYNNCGGKYKINSEYARATSGTTVGIPGPGAVAWSSAYDYVYMDFECVAGEGN